MPKRKFTDEQEAIIAQQYLGGHSSGELAKLYNVNDTTILGALKRQGVPRRKQGIQPQEIPIIVKMYKEGIPAHQIAKQFHHDATAVYNLLRKQGCWVGGSRLFTDEQEAVIAQRYLEGESTRALARDLGCDRIAIKGTLERQGVEQRSPAERNRVYVLNPHVFDVIDNELAAYWLGFAYADGCVYKKTFKAGLRGADGNHLKKLRAFMQSESPVHRYTTKSGHKVAHIEFTDQHLAQQLRQLGIIPKRSKFQAMIEQVPEHLYHHWLRGLFDGDGSARKRPGIEFCGSKEMMEWIRVLLSKKAQTNPNLGIQKHTTANLYYLRYDGRKQAIRIAAYMYQDATTWMDRKRDKIKHWPKPQEPKRNALGQYS